MFPEEMAQLEKKRKECIDRVKNRIFEDDDDELRTYGFESPQVQLYMAKSVESWLGQIDQKQGVL